MRSNGSQHERDEENDASSKLVVPEAISGCIALEYKDLEFVSIRTHQCGSFLFAACQAQSSCTLDKEFIESIDTHVRILSVLMPELGKQIDAERRRMQRKGPVFDGDLRLPHYQQIGIGT